MKKVAAIALGILTLWQTPSRAAGFDEDLQHLQYAMDFSGFKQGDLEKFHDPLVGARTFRLSAQNAPWAGNYFPMENGGIATRWQKGTEHAQLDHLPQKKDLLKMKQDQIDQLSPAEKFDILRGDYKFAVTRHELTRRGPYRALKPQDWEGFCNGVRCAGILLQEPQQTLSVTNPDGIVVRFLPADLKALGGASYFYVEQYAQIGSPSKINHAQTQPNAAVFDLALRYYLSKNKKAFLIDSHLGTEVWNESIVGYKRELSPTLDLTPAESAQYPWAVSKMHIKTRLDSLGEIGIEESNQPTKAKVAAGELHKKITVGYTLYLDKNGQASDGVWDEQPYGKGVDFAWFGGGAGKDSDYSEVGVGNASMDFAVLKDLFAKAAHPSCQKLFLD